MASSQVELASPAPFGCALKDHGHRRDGYADPNKSAAALSSQDTFHNKLLKGLVRDHLRVKNVRVDPWFVEDPRNDPFEREGQCSTLSPSQARVVDRWAAQQARGMVSTIEKHAQEADLLYKSDSWKPGESASASASLGETSPSQSLYSSNKGASSLVQMWEARLSRPNGTNNNANSLGCCSRSNSSALSCPENVLSSPREESLAYVEGVRPPTNEDLLAEWESDGAGTFKDPSPSFKGRASSASESERGRVANIIRRLTSTVDANENDQSPAAESPYRERERTPRRPDHAATDQKSFLLATSSPRFRGRQASSDLLMQMERDRHKELETLSDRRAVSKFSQKGRIQANLKLKILQRGLAAREQHPLALFRCTGRVSVPNSPNILPLREKIKTAAELDLKEHSGCADLGASPLEIMSNVSQMATTSASDQPSEDINHEMCRSPEPDSEVMAPPSMESTTSKYEEDSGSRTLDAAAEILSYEDPSLERQQSMDACSSSGSGFWYEDEQEADGELETTDSNYDWISKISRPRSYWEDRRQSWYQEMLEQDSANEDILQLLQRRRVSTFLCSDLRERMDDMLLCCVRKQKHMLSLPEDSLNHLDFTALAISQSRDHSAGHQQQDGEPMQGRERDQLQMEESGTHEIEEVIDGGVDEAEQEERLVEEAAEEMVEGDERSITGEQHRDVSDHSRLSPLSLQSSSFESPTRSWGFDDHNQAACLSSAQSPRSRAYYMDPLQHTSSMNHLSMEIELINELRGQMKQLRREMSDLRRSIKTCMDFQTTMQYSMKQDISSSARGDDGMSMKKPLRKRVCCICYDKPIDSLLYRCGHMCTCLKCAVKLQFGSGKCPTCRAPIEDVVRAHPDSGK